MYIRLYIYVSIPCKEQTFKISRKIGLIPSIFGITEPVLFGVPIMLNPFLFIPYIISPIVCTLLSYFAYASGIVPKLTGTEVNWTVPPVISGFYPRDGRQQYCR